MQLFYVHPGDFGVGASVLKASRVSITDFYAPILNRTMRLRSILQPSFAQRFHLSLRWNLDSNEIVPQFPDTKKKQHTLLPPLTLRSACYAIAKPTSSLTMRTWMCHPILLLRACGDMNTERNLPSRRTRWPPVYHSAMASSTVPVFHCAWIMAANGQSITRHKIVQCQRSSYVLLFAAIEALREIKHPGYNNVSDLIHV